MTQSIERRLPDVKMTSKGVNLTKLDEASAFCQLVHQSKLAPRSLDSKEKIFVALQTGLEAGLSPMASLRSVFVVNGMPAWKGEAAVGLIRNHPDCVIFDMVCKGDGDARKAVVRTQRRGSPNWSEVTFTVADAKAAGLWGKSGPWTQYPEDMLIWRAVSRASKRYWADVLLSLPLATEVQDYGSKPAVTPREQEAPPTGADALLVGLVEKVDEETGEVMTDDNGNELTPVVVAAEPADICPNCTEAHRPSEPCTPEPTETKGMFDED